MKVNYKKRLAWLLIFCMVIPNGFTAFAHTQSGEELIDSDSGKNKLWTSSFETPDGFLTNTADEKGSGGLQPVSSNALTGDITYLVDLSTVTGSANYNNNEVKENLFDHNSATKFLSNVAAPATVSWSLTGKAEKTVKEYAMVAANDVPDRDPKSWQLFGKKEGDADYTLIDERTNQAFSERLHSKIYTVKSPGAYSSYKLSITRNASSQGTSGMTQFADLILATGDSADDQYKTSGMSAAISTGPSSTWNQNANAGWSGSKALKVTGSITDQDAYAYNKLYDGLNIPVGDDTYFQYCIFPSMSNGSGYDYQYAQMYLSLDLKFTDGTYLSELGALDQNRNGLDALSQGDSRTLTTNQWNRIYSNIGSVASGKTIEAVLADYRKPSHDMSGYKDFTTYFDEIEVYNKTPLTISHLSDYTYILRGTNDSPGFSRGLTAPAVTMPHGFNFWVPATNSNDNKIYDYQDTALRYITVCHEPSYWVGDRGTWQFMINTSLKAATDNNYALGSLTSDFSHENEIARANYYSVEFDKAKGASAGSRLELTPTVHGAAVRFTFDSTAANRNVIFDCVRAGGDLIYDNSGAVTTFKGYSDHTGNGSKRMYLYGTFDQKALLTRESAKGGIAAFDKDVVEMKIATSYISYEQAQKNLELEIAADEKFDDVYVKARNTWDEKLNVISDVKGATYEQLVSLYSNLYRLFAYPNTMSENTGTESEPVWQYKSPYRDSSAPAVEGQFYINNGFWDTYRTTWAAYSLFTPGEASVMLNGLVQHYNDQGWVPRWIAPGGTNSMVGTSSDVIFADAVVKGLDFDWEGAYASALRNAASVSSNLTNGGRKNLNTAIFLGYNPGTSEDFSWSMESYINDYGIARMAKILADRETQESKKSEYLAEYQYYINRAKNYVKLFDNSGSTPLNQWFRGKDASGEWNTANFTNNAFDPFYWGENYTETNAYNMAVSVPQDGQGLANLYGGLDGLAQKLDSIFETNGIYNGYGAVNSVGGIHEQKEAREIKLGQYGHSNQPSHHIIYMYNYAAQPWKTQKYVRDILDRAYVGSTFGQGYIGDEDNGEMSAWYVFSALGFYPVNMGSDEFAVGSPLFEEATVNLQGGGTLTVKAHNNSRENVYIQSMALNGEEYNKSFIKYADICNGGTIEFTMGAQPNETWGTGTENLPESLTAPEEEVKTYEDFTSPGVNIVNTDTITTEPVYQDRLAGNASNLKNLVDNNSGTETVFADGDTLYYSMDKAGKAELFTITSGKTGPAPASVTVYGAVENGDWVELAAYDNMEFQWSQYTRPFSIKEEKQDLYSHYKFVFGNGMVSEIELLGYEDSARTKDDLGRLIQAAGQIDQTGLPEVLKAVLAAAVAAAELVYDDTEASDEDYTRAYNDLKRALETVNGSLVNAYERMEAESFNSGNVLIDYVNGVPNNIGGVKKDYWAGYKNVLFAGDTNFMELHYSAQGTDGGGYVEIYLDDINSSPVGRIQTPVTAPNGWAEYVTVNTEISPAITGLHDVYLVFRNDGTHAYVANVDWFRFEAYCKVSGTAGENGTIDLADQTVPYGQSVSFQVDPEDGYVVDQLLLNGEDTGFKGNGSESTLYTIDKVIKDTIVTVRFRPIETGSATAVQTEGAVITFRPGDGTTDVPEGTVITADITLEAGRNLKKILLNGIELGTEAVTHNEDGTYTVVFRMGRGSHVLSVELYGEDEATVTGIIIKKYPDKLVYYVNDPLDLTGMEVVAVYSDETTAVIKDYFVDTINPTTMAGVTLVEISYRGVVAGFEITVLEKEPENDLTGLEVTKNPDKLIYRIGEALDLAGMEVTATYKDGTTAVIPDYQVLTPNPTIKAGTVNVIVGYSGLTASFRITVLPDDLPPVSLTGLEITKLPLKLNYELREPLRLQGMEVLAVYSDGRKEAVTGYEVITQNPTARTGRVTVTIGYEGKTASFQITVTRRQTETPSVVMTGITISEKPGKLIYKVSEALDLSGLVVKAVYSDGTSYTADNYSVVTQNPTAVAGKVTITITYAGHTAAFEITVIQPPTGIALKETNKALFTGESFALMSELTPEGAESKLVYHSGNPLAAVVSADGIVTAKSAGRAVITVQTENGYTAACTVTVRNKVVSVKLNASKKTLGIGEKFKLIPVLNPKDAVGKVTFTSSNKAVAVISSTGIIAARKTGTAKITVVTDNGKSAVCTITVKKAPVSLKVNAKAVTLKSKKTYQLKALLSKGSAGTVTYQSSNRGVVSVSTKGKLTAGKKGTAVVTVKTYNNKTVKVKVTVK